MDMALYKSIIIIIIDWLREREREREALIVEIVRLPTSCKFLK